MYGDKRRQQRIIDFKPLLKKEIIVKFRGGRQLKGILLGWDRLNNLVLDNAIEFLRNPLDSSKFSGETRELGLTVTRGTAFTYIMSTADLATQPIVLPDIPTTQEEEK
eukprot:gnl/Dysnectes_brevis/1170_a1304_3934.p1 GENE.gnl/Dysnectes_brevis/1170_a1304_3934~~gnl/Dysnectes_brevis/1170_a1304_3934.p1  ORF type:complete len:108 (-),score=18.18 gnl/Dysnectes_brevis/1170_a1304_3934:48-371(-)